LPTQPRRRASHPTGRSAVLTPSGERPRPPKLPRARAAALIRSVADAAGAEKRHGSRVLQMQLQRRASHPTGRSAEQTPSSERPVLLKLPRAREAALIGSVADAAAAASVTPKRAISGARAEQRAACAAQASERERGSGDRERCQRSCGGERHTRHSDQRCTCRAERGVCSSSFRAREQQR
jgi:hypothetical protein